MNKRLATEGSLRISEQNPPSVVVMEFDDPAELTGAFDGLVEFKQDIVSLGSKPLQVKRVILRLGKSVLIYQRTSHPLRTYTISRPELVAFLVTGPHASGSLNGRNLAPGMLISASPGAEAEIVVNERYSSVALLISPDEIASHLSKFGRVGELEVPDGFAFHQPNLPSANRLYDLGKKVSNKAQKYQRLFNEIEGVRQALLHGASAAHNLPLPIDIAQAPASNSGRPSSVILFRMCTPILTSVF